MICIHTHINKYAYIHTYTRCVFMCHYLSINQTELMPMTHVQPVDTSGTFIISCNFCKEMGSRDGRPSTNAQRCGNLGMFDKKAAFIP